MEIENLKKTFSFICCCKKRNSLDEDQEEKSEVDTAIPHENSANKSVELSSFSVTPHFRARALSFVIGVDSIDALMSDFDNSVGYYVISFTNTP